jgi:RNA-directed DNA polymerase
LLSNIYMRRFLKGWKTGGHEKRLAARIVNYADDCAPRRRERRTSGVHLERHAA